MTKIPYQSISNSGDKVSVWVYYKAFDKEKKIVMATATTITKGNNNICKHVQ